MADDISPRSPARNGGTGTAAAARGPGFVALPSGLAIRHYVIEEVIGAGGFGITYRAHHERLTSKIFALKEYFPRQFATRSGTHVVSTPDGEGLFGWGLDRFLKEAEALSKCEHPGIVHVVDYFEANGTAYAVLGYVEGQQLGQWLASLGRPPTQAELDKIIMPLLDALEVVHGAKLLHRDIAPDNILIRRDGMPCLIDFGACREDIRERSHKVSAIVKHGYSPPEQYHGIAELQGPWTDIYAVGATLYRAISGQPPMDSTRRGALGDGLKPVSDMTEEPYRPGFMSAIDMSLRLKPEERPQSVSDWRSMLVREDVPKQPLLDPRGGDKQSESKDDKGEERAPPDPKPLPPSPGPGRGLVLAGLGVLLLATMAAIAFWRSPTPPLPPEPPSKKDAVKTADTTLGDKGGPIVPFSPDPEQEAAKAWVTLSSSTDQSAIERFIDLHGTTSTAGEARKRLQTLKEDAKRRDEERTRQAAEQAAASAWSTLRSSTDPDAIERFLQQHGSSAFAAEARTRLGSLRAAAARDAAWAACRSAADTAKASACTPVIDGDDTALRRAEALQLRGNQNRRDGAYDRAIADLGRSLELRPGHAQTHVDRGVAHFLRNASGDRDASIRDYDAAIRIDARHAEALNNRAWAIFQAGRPADALADATRSIEATPTNGYAYDTRGQILEALGRRDEAIRDYERAVQIDQSQETSRAGLARLRGNRR